MSKMSESNAQYLSIIMLLYVGIRSFVRRYFWNSEFVSPSFSRFRYGLSSSSILFSPRASDFCIIIDRKGDANPSHNSC